MSKITSAKLHWRKEMRRRLALLSPASKQSESLHIQSQINQLIQSSPLPHPRIALFAALPHEPSLLDLVPAHPKVHWFLPRILNSQNLTFLPVPKNTPLIPGPFNIHEPPKHLPPTENLDLILCPGLAFTPQGHRLGQGKGYYDRALIQFPNAEKIGICFHCQLTPQLPTSPHDQTMHRIITAHPATEA